jgi:murein L,D-transpeptidase YcbB/YkuD
VAVVLLVAAACDREPRGEPSPFLQAQLTGADGGVVLQLPDGDTLHVSSEVVAFYRGRGYRQAWTDYDEIEERGWALLRVMESAVDDGLDPERYRFPLAMRMVQQVEGDSIAEEDEPAQMARVDLVLSEVFGRYAHHLRGGVLEPSVSGLDWRIPKDSARVQELLTQLADGGDASAAVARLRPSAPVYHALMEQLVKYRGIAAAGGWPEVPENVESEVGSRAQGVALLRQRLIAEGDAEEVRLAQMGNAAAATFDENLKAALEHFQQRHGIAADGAIGPSTRKELNTSADARVQQILLNMDQWRWLPQELGERYILVNVAGFEMEYVKNDSVALAMNVVVGQEGWETPIFTDTMEHIVFNPYWNVPESIKQDEVIPAIQRDPSYLSRHNMEALAGGRVVGGLDHGNLGAYTFRQRPGGNNALGEVKFLFPNRHNVYLHDTPADQLFSQTSRAFSHGCIRLEKPLELARMLLTDVTDRPASDVEKLTARDSEQWVNLTEPLPVYILYFTAWAGRDGSMRFYPDVYERDERLQEQAESELGIAELD